MFSGQGLHHLNKRKRVHKKLQKYPHPRRWIRLLDRILLVVAIVGPMAMIPQLWQIYFYRDATGVSVFSFLMFAIFNVFWIGYGMAHKERPILLTYFLWFTMNLAVAIGALIYG
jgi:uncharacterized protein with PQ loop repeat